MTELKTVCEGCLEIKYLHIKAKWTVKKSKKYIYICKADLWKWKNSVNVTARKLCKYISNL